MDSEEKLFRRLSRRPIEEINEVIHSIWMNNSKAERIAILETPERINAILEPYGWTYEEYNNSIMNIYNWRPLI